MTREEASFILANIDRRVCDDELNDALDMAISALEQEPCDDATPKDIFCIGCDYKEQEHCTHWKNGKCSGNTEPCDDAISRKAVINAIENDCMKGGLGSCFACYNDAQAFRGEIEKLPSVTQKPIEYDDAISRDAAIEAVKQAIYNHDSAIMRLTELPSVNPQPCEDAVSRPSVIKFEGTNMACMGGDEIMKEFENNIQQHCDDKVISLERAKKQIGRWIGYIDQDMINRICISLEQLPSVTQKSGKWIALVARPMTNEEREYYSEQLDYCDGDAVIYNCPLPEEGQDVLITTCTGVVLIDTFFNDYDGCGFEGYDIEDVKAWMPLPKPYEPPESEG